MRTCDIEILPGPITMITSNDANNKRSSSTPPCPVRFCVPFTTNIAPSITIASIDGTSDYLSQAAQRMHTFKIGSVIIVDSNGDLVGMITKTDITKVYGTVYGAKFKVKDYMSKKVF
ncbi:MAG: CBS domain-containing protein, partial [Nitrosopumilus sp.]|nr:CBS domain-containing protein [Nitrosopumilus sp.]